MEQAPEWFNGNDIKEYLKYNDLIPAMEQALACFSRRDGVIQPVRTVIQTEKVNG